MIGPGLWCAKYYGVGASFQSIMPSNARRGEGKGREGTDEDCEIINLFFSFGQNPSEFFFGALGIFLRKLPYSGSLDRPRSEICQNKSYTHVTLTDTDVTNYEGTLLRTTHKTGATSYMYVTFRHIDVLKIK